MRILLYRWKVFNQDDVKSAIEYFGHEVHDYTETVIDKDDETGFKLRDYVELRQVFSAYDCVFSLNYFPHVSDLCEELGKKYIAWTVDSPLISLYHQSLFNKCNYIFIFDRFYAEELKSLGAEHVWYLPLAVNCSRVDKITDSLTADERNKWHSEVSFVGGMYHRNSYDEIKDRLPEYLRGYFDAAMAAQMEIYGDSIFDKVLTVDILEKLCELIDFKQDERAFSDIALVFSSTFLGFKLANIERVQILNKLAKHFPTDLYTDDPDKELIGVNLKGAVNYMTDMPKVFNCSRININPVMRNIRTGIPLRAWDIVGAGGFLMTSFQLEYMDFFENGKDYVYYESHDDLLRKTEYYLNHEDERAQIARNGHEKAVKFHSYEKRMEFILDKCGMLKH
jgi:spore maturation protein CgeB